MDTERFCGFASIKDWWTTKVRDELGRPSDLPDSIIDELFDANYSVNEACRRIMQLTNPDE